MQIQSFDELGTEKEIKLFGKTTSLKIQRLKILIIGASPLGCEIAKHLMQQQPELITILDQSRGKQLDKTLKQYTQLTQIHLIECALNDPELLKVADRHDLVILCDIHSIKLVKSINAHLRSNVEHQTNKRFNQGLIWTFTLGFTCLAFFDFGDGFKVFDKDGETPFPYHINAITQAAPGVVSIDPTIPHNFKTGDFVCIHEVEGMTEVNGVEPRPIKVISPTEFSLEDTTKFKKYEKDGLVQLAKVPQRLKFETIEYAINNPIFERNNTNCTIYATMIGIIKCIDNDVTVNEQNVTDQCKLIFLELFNEYQIDNVLLNKVLQQHSQLRIPVVTFWSGVCSLEAIKFTGKYTPQSSLFVSFIQDIEINDNNIKEQFQNLSALLIGCGGTGCEMVRQLAMMEACSLPGSKFSIVDDDVVRKYNQIGHLWFRPNTFGQSKCKVAQDQAWALCQNMNIDLIHTKIHEDSTYVKDHQIIISAINNNHARTLIQLQANKHNKVLFDQSLNGLKAYTQIIQPGIEMNQEDDLKQVFNVSKETYKKFPYLPYHSILWAKDVFENSFVGFVTDFQKYIQNPSEYIKNSDDTETSLLKAHIIDRITKPEFNLNLDKILSLSKELFDYHFYHRIKLLLQEYPDNEIDTIWVGYKMAPVPIKFDAKNEQHVTYIQITTLLISKIFNINSQAVLKPEFVMDKLHQMKESYWNLTKPQQPNTQECSQKYQPTVLHFDDDDIRGLYIRCLHSLTNLRSKNYQITTLPLHKVQKYALEINRSNPMMHSIIVGQMGVELYKLLYTKCTHRRMHVDMNKNIIQFY